MGNFTHVEEREKQHNRANFVLELSEDRYEFAKETFGKGEEVTEKLILQIRYD